MKTGGARGIAIILAVIAYTAIVPTIHARHRTNFLDALYGEVTSRVADPGTNTARQKAALRAARNILRHNTRTFSGDLSALATAATVLNRRFPGDATLLSLEENALRAYDNEISVKLDGTKVRVEGFSNDIPRRVLRQFIQATNALNSYHANTGGVPQRARALARVFNKAYKPVTAIYKRHPHPAGQSPTSIEYSLNLDFFVPRFENPQTVYYCDTVDEGGNPTNEYFCKHQDAEVERGTWQYIKTGPGTATVRLTPSSPSGLGVHEFRLFFETTRTGTFTGSNFQGQAIQGDLLID
jgi:hypothetical protein